MPASDRYSFSGFPDGRLTWTPIPDVFFTELLPRIDDIDELKILLHLFWRIARKREYPRFASRRELEVDRTLLDGLSNVRSNRLATLSRGLEDLVEHGVLIHRLIAFGDRSDECYFLNTAQGRRMIKQLEERSIDVGQVVEPEEPILVNERPSIYTLYEQNVGLLTPLIVDMLRNAENQYPPEWIVDAFKEAVTRNRRSWRYIERILARWSEEGRDDGTTA